MNFFINVINKYNLLGEFKNNVYKIYDVVILDNNEFGITMSNEGLSLDNVKLQNYLFNNLETFYNSFENALRFILYMNNLKIFHMDLKPANICFNFELKIFVLIDFGLAEVDLFLLNNSFSSGQTCALNNIIKYRGTKLFFSPFALANLYVNLCDEEIYSYFLTIVKVIYISRFINYENILNINYQKVSKNIELSIYIEILYKNIFLESYDNKIKISLRFLNLKLKHIILDYFYYNLKSKFIYEQKNINSQLLYEEYKILNNIQENQNSYIMKNSYKNELIKIF